MSKKNLQTRQGSNTRYVIFQGSVISAKMFQAKNSRFNIAMPAALDDDALKQAQILVSRIRADPNIDFYNSWKVSDRNLFAYLGKYWQATYKTPHVNAMS